MAGSAHVNEERYSRVLPAESVEFEGGDDPDDGGEFVEASSVAGREYFPVFHMGDAAFDGGSNACDCFVFALSLSDGWPRLGFFRGVIAWVPWWAASANVGVSLRTFSQPHSANALRSCIAPGRGAEIPSRPPFMSDATCRFNPDRCRLPE